ncbi:uncharacterized protein LOC128712686 [Anopheles marshallii]|uniref:uncharacterized protein LOC128712686 n=1 Tax=Anopheles marshallii TaxID=1521116 RepID=UPI00237B8EE2|nr:uncharacterized protein LOC128712686 [Anopheles marshallii]
MEDPLNERTEKKRTPTQSVESLTEIKQEPLDEGIAEPKVEFLQLVSSWDCIDPLKDEMEIGETGLTVQDPFYMIQEHVMKTEPMTEETEEIEDYGDFVHSSTKCKKSNDEIKSEGDLDVVKSPLQPEYSSDEMLYCSNVESWAWQDMGEQNVNKNIPLVYSSSKVGDGGSGGPSRVNNYVADHDCIPASGFSLTVAKPKSRLSYFSGHIAPPQQPRATTVFLSSAVQRSEELPVARNIEILEFKPFIETESFTEITSVTSKEELDKLEEFLSIESNLQSMVKCISSLLTTDDAANRFCEALYIAVNDKFLIQCSWGGSGKDGPKIAFNRYVNLHNFLRIVADEGINSLEWADYEKILRSKLKHAKNRLRFKDMRKSFCKFKRKSQSIDPFFDTVSPTEIIPVTSKEELDRLEEYLNTDSNIQSMVEQNGVHNLEKKEFEQILRLKNITHSVCRHKHSNSNSIYRHRVMNASSTMEISPVKSKEELDKLEEFLSTESNMQNMAKHLNSLVTAHDAAMRFCGALFILVCDTFLTQCSWMGGGKNGPKIAMRRYIKLQSLLRLVAEDSVNSLEGKDYERILRSKIKNAKCRLRNKNIRKRFCKFKNLTVNMKSTDESNSRNTVIETGTVIEISPVKSKEELDKLEDFLSTESNMQYMVRRLSSLLTADDAANRFCEALYIVVSDMFLIQCSWRGGGQGGPKIAFNRYVKLQNLLRIVAGDSMNNLEMVDCEKILRTRLKHAKNTLRFKDMRKRICRFKKRVTNSSNIHGAHSIDPVFDSGSSTEITSIKSKEELDKLEEFLSIESNLQSMVKCISNLLTTDEAAKRFCEALYIAVNDKFLIQCSWGGSGKDGPKIAFNRYVNLHNFLRIVADKGLNSLEWADYEKILRSKLKHAKNRLRFKDMRRSNCRFKKRDTNRSNIHESLSSNPVLNSVSTSNISPETKSTTEISPEDGSTMAISTVKSKQELDWLEEFLNTDNNMQNMAKRLNKLMCAQGAVSRFSEALHIVVSNDLLAQCSWLVEGKCRTRIGLQKYVNLQDLLRLLAEDSVHTLRKAEFEKMFKMNISDAKRTKRFKQS